LPSLQNAGSDHANWEAAMTITSRLTVSGIASVALVSVLAVSPVSAQDAQNTDSAQTKGGQAQSQDNKEAVPPEERDDLETFEASLNNAGITIYADDNYGGRSKTLWLRDGAIISLRNCPGLHDKISSFELTAPRGTSVTVYEKNLCYNCTTYSGTWWGRNVEFGVDKKDLKWLGVHDNISRMEFLFDGFLPNDRIQSPRC
jgi:hypothetical protein